MNNEGKPQTAAELLALPEGGGFGMRIDIIDGKEARRPIAPDVVAIFHEEHEPISCLDQNGDAWYLGRYANGQWFRHRRW